MKKTTGFDRSKTRQWHPATQAVRGGTWRSEHGETSEALFLTSGYTYVKLPGIEKFELATAALFDLGVFFCVLGAVLLAIATLSRLAQRTQDRERRGG